MCAIVIDKNLVYFWISFGIFVVGRVGNTGPHQGLEMARASTFAARPARS